jgi:pimeloyl-ACP methyl ester carboxylesterase
MLPHMPTVSANGLEFAYLEAGPSDGPLALCLHGFPDAAPTWNALLAELADAGFHAVAPWLRGYAPTSIPADGVYQTGALVADANALHEALGGGPDAVIIGHDWGAIATYGIAVSAPERWRRVVTMAVPPAAALGMGFLSYKQLQRSWYMFFFQNPLAEMAVGMNDLEFIDGLWADWSPGYDGTEHIAHVKDALRDPANLAAAIGYYRAMFSPDAPKDPSLDELQAATSGVPTQPVLYLHGRNDGCLGVDLTTNAAMFLSPESRVEVLDDCGHFLQVEKPAEVNKLVLDWLS